MFSFLRCGTRPYVGKVAGRFGGKKTHHRVSCTTTGKVTKRIKSPYRGYSYKQYIYYPVHSHLSLIGQFNTPAARKGVYCEIGTRKKKKRRREKVFEPACGDQEELGLIHSYSLYLSCLTPTLLYLVRGGGNRQVRCRTITGNFFFLPTTTIMKEGKIEIRIQYISGQ